MVVFGVMVDAAIAVFVILVLAKYAGVTSKKGFAWIASAGVVGLLAASSAWIAVADSTVAGLSGGLTALFSVIAWILLLVGALTTVMDWIKK